MPRKTLFICLLRKTLKGAFGLVPESHVSNQLPKENTGSFFRGLKIQYQGKKKNNRMIVGDAYYVRKEVSPTRVFF
jgi:hypothetical protein